MCLKHINDDDEKYTFNCFKFSFYWVSDLFINQKEASKFKNENYYWVLKIEGTYIDDEEWAVGANTDEEILQIYLREVWAKFMRYKILVSLWQSMMQRLLFLTLSCFSSKNST